MSDWIEKDRLECLLREQAPLIDVRAEVEQLSGTIPASCTAPILNDKEREVVGTTYRFEGLERAIALGHQLVCGRVKDERVASWVKAVREDGCQGLFCWRGGMRSEIAQKWLADAGVCIPRVRGGYKALRHILLNALEVLPVKLPALVLGGETGAGKTELLRDMSEELPFIDFEQLANHRGSSFGRRCGWQPSQATFENFIGQQLLSAEYKAGEALLFEDESRSVGGLGIPNRLFSVLREVPLVLLQVPREERAARIRDEYIAQELSESVERERVYSELKGKMSGALFRIRKALGGLRHDSCLRMMDDAFAGVPADENLNLHDRWIEYLLEHYYDPYYQRHINRQRHRVVLVGDWTELREILPDHAGGLAKAHARAIKSR